MHVESGAKKAELRGLYTDLKQYLEGINIKKEIAKHVTKCLTC